MSSFTEFLFSREIEQSADADMRLETCLEQNGKIQIQRCVVCCVLHPPTRSDRYKLYSLDYWTSNFLSFLIQTG